MIKFLVPQKSLSAAFYKLPVLQSEIEKLSSNLKTYINQGKDDESEEYHKGLIKDFLANTWYNPDYSVNTNGREDLVIYNGNGTESKPAVIIEAKSPANTSEMFSEKNLNCKALQECVYYFMQESLKFGNKEVKHIIITDYNDFYIFDAKDFSRFFLAKTNPIVEQFNMFEAKQLSDTKTSYFYENCAKPAIEKWFENEIVTITHFAPKDYYGKHEEKLVALYKILSPEHLLNKPFANDSNSLDKNFYAELLYIIGLEEVKVNGKKLIRRKEEKERNRASLLESAIYQLEDQLSNEKRIFETALHLTITWVNRLLFLKLLESQQLAYQKGNTDYRFLTIEKVDSFDELNILFFKVLGRMVDERDSETQEKYCHVPYLNSSLFELSDEERLLQIHGIQNKPLSLYSKTVLKDERGRRLSGEMDNLEYIFKFLDAYNFSSEGAGGIMQSSKTLINASVLGLIFEKINGYKDGSFYTPGFITEYMAKETIERAVIQKFNNTKGWKCKTLDDVANEIEDRNEANQIINSIRICDPAVGSGHFLVSVLNRLLFIKSYLNILLDKDGKRIKNSDWELRLENDEISVLDEDSNPFTYTTNAERQRVQEMLFNEKRTIIENCLFGADINPASVYICRLRLWIELLKNTYYTASSGYSQLETLPNIDINIKCGNSLVSKFPVNVGRSIMKNADNGVNTADFRKRIKEYRDAVAKYKNESNKENKRKVEQLIESIKNKICSEVQLDLFDKEWNEKASAESIYKDSLEWMLEFPEVLDEEGKFVGFDAVIGNPPYISAPAQVADKKMNEQRIAITECKRYRSLYQKWDIYIPFIELGLLIGNKNAVCAMIVPYPLTNQTYAKILRKIIAEETNLFELCDLNGTKVFDEATVSNCIPFMQKGSETRITWISNIDENCTIHHIFEKPISELVQDTDSLVWNVTQEKRETDRHKDMHVLGDYCYISEGMKLNADEKIARGEFSKADLISNIKDEKHPSEYFEGKDIERYFLKNKPRYLEYGTERVPSKLRRPTFPELYSNKKLMFNILGELHCVYDDKKVLHSTSIISAVPWIYLHNVENKSISSSIKKFSVMTRPEMENLSMSVDLRYILGIMNSSYASVLLTNNRGDDYHIYAEHIRNIPIPSATQEQQQPIIDLVDKILAAKKADAKADTSALEEQIDEMVYHLYGLSYDEVLVVDSDTKITREEYEKK